MIKYQGSVASKGVAIGFIRESTQKPKKIKSKSITDKDAEKARFVKAKEKTISQLEDLYELALKEVGEADALIFEIHKLMIEDENYADAILSVIDTQSVNAEYAVGVTGDNFMDMFAQMDNDYMKERATDIKDISARLVNAFKDEKEAEVTFDEPCIIVADDLTPSETVQMDKNKILGFITRKGSINSHTAILSRTMAIPAIVGVDVPSSINGKMAIVDGHNACFTLDPDEETIEKARVQIKEDKKNKSLLQQYKGKKTQTKSGKKINLYANVSSVADVGLAIQNDAEGIGLFRSEFLYLEQNDYPSEELQFMVYKQIVEMMAGKKVIVRTLDIGADKQVDYFNIGAEENPALGYRAVRICISQEDVFKTQLRALIRSSLFGKVSIMIPMIASEWEVIRVKEIIQEVKNELDASKILYGKFEFGIMIETPAAVMIASDLAKHVDFFSIGTNDLIQYTLAIDRQNQKLEPFYNPRHPAVLKMIKMVAKAAKDNNIWSGICGDLAADTKLTAKFIDYGIDELSVTPSSIFAVRKAIRDLE